MPNPYAPTERALGSLADRIERMMGARAGHKARMSEMEMAHTGTMAGLGLQKQRLGLAQERFAAERPGIEARTEASQIGLRAAEREEEKVLEQEARLNEPSEIFGNQQAFEETFGFFDTDVWNRVVTGSVPKNKHITDAQGNIVGLKVTKKEAQELSSVILPQIRTQDWEKVENASRALMGTMDPKAPEYKQAEALNKTASEMLQYFTKTPGAREHRRRVRGDPLSKTEKQAADMFMQQNFGSEFKMETMQGPDGQIMSYPIQKGVATAWPEGWGPVEKRKEPAPITEVQKFKKKISIGGLRTELSSDADDFNLFEAQSPIFNTENKRNEIAYWKTGGFLTDEKTKFIKLPKQAIKVGWTSAKIQEAADTKGMTVEEVLSELGILE